MSQGLRRRRRAQIAASRRQQYWSSTLRVTSLRAGEDRAMYPAGLPRVSKSRGPEPSTQSWSIAKETCGWEEALVGTVSKSLRAMGSFCGSLVLADQEHRRGNNPSL